MAIGIITEQGQLITKNKNELTAADCLEIEGDYTGTYADPVRIFSYGHGGIYTATYSSSPWFKCVNYSGVDIDNNFPLSTSKYYIFTYFSGDDPTSPNYFNVDCIVDSDATSALLHLLDGGWTYDYKLYYGSLSDAQESGACDDISDREWDETPTEDENNQYNEDAIGGEYADRGSFNANDLMLLEDMPDPHADEMTFGGLITCYALHATELERISAALLTPNFWTSLKNKFEGLTDPMSFILDAVELPLPITDYGIYPFKLGGIQVNDTNGNPIGCATYPYRFKKYNMGAISLKEVWGSEKDYSCTTISVFLPYVGVKELDPDIVLNSVLTLVLYVDRWNGDILYLLHTSNNTAQQKYYRQESVVYRFTGNCGRKIPLGRVDNSNQIIQAVSGLAGIAAGYAMGGVTGAIGGAVPTIQNIAAGNFKPTVQTSGGVSGNTGRMDYQQAYLIIKRGVPEYPNNWRNEIGAPRNQELLISSLSGYTLFSTVYLENIECMAEEKEELEKLLTTEGVIL